MHASKNNNKEIIWKLNNLFQSVSMSSQCHLSRWDCESLAAADHMTSQRCQLSYLNEPQHTEHWGCEMRHAGLKNQLLENIYHLVTSAKNYRGLVPIVCVSVIAN